MQFSTLLFVIKDNVAQITLNRPEVRNAINLEMARDFMRVAIRCSEDSTIRAVMINGSGGAFCAGGDLKSATAEGENLVYHLKEMTSYFHTAMSCLARMESPVVVAVEGVAAGAGMSLACAGDIVVASESARFTMAYTRVGLTPDAAATYFLPRIVGFRRALELVLTSRELSAQEAYDLGIVNHVVPDSDLLVHAHAITKQLAAGATQAIGASKRLLHCGWTETLETQMERESKSVVNMTRTADFHEAVSAFLERRAPKFTGQ